MSTLSDAHAKPSGSDKPVSVLSSVLEEIVIGAARAIGQVENCARAPSAVNVAQPGPSGASSGASSMLASISTVASTSTSASTSGPPVCLLSNPQPASKAIQTSRMGTNVRQFAIASHPGAVLNAP